MHEVDILSNLTDAQREAVTHVDGPLLVLAGAGSGKTRVVTRRIAYLLTRDIRPWNILAITFTNKAAGEMIERVAALTTAKGLRISTFHSFCARELRRYAERAGLSPNYTIYDTSDRTKVIRDCMSALDIDPKMTKPQAVEATISRAKNHMESAADYAAHVGGYYEELVAKIYARYEQEMHTRAALDFDDLLLRMVQLLDDAATRAEMEKRFRYVLVDEYQDTNAAQYRIVRRLTENHRNICVTGDPDQAIYGWRGADINNILSFERDYPGARTVRLERNYRSTKTILAAAGDLIVHNQARKAKELHTENDAGARISLMESADEIEEARLVVHDIREAIREGVKPHDVAVFYRVNALSRALEVEFRRAMLPYRIVSGTAFFDRREVRDLVAYLRLLANRADDVACERVVNVPPRGIGKTSLDHAKAFASTHGLSLFETLRRAQDVPAIGARATNACGPFVELVESLAAFDGTPSELVKEIIERTGYVRTLGKSEEDAERVLNIDQLVNMVADYEESAETPTLIGFLETSALVCEQDGLDDKSPTVSLMTLHAAKGLEFPSVYVVGCEEGLLPHDRSKDSEHKVEEERRLLYVGMTRAKRDLTLSYALRRRTYGTFFDTSPSRFLGEISPQHLVRKGIGIPAPSVAPAPGRPLPSRATGESRTLGAGDSVKHPLWGTGRVKSVSGSGEKLKAVVDFGPAGTKTLMVAFAKLEKLTPM